jgi:hypothetical protein
MVNNATKLQAFQSNPPSITTTNTTAVNARVLNVCKLNAIVNYS